MIAARWETHGGMELWRNRSLRRPASSGVAGVALAVVTLWIDAVLPAGWLFGWQPPAAGARALLAAVTGSIITVSALVFWVRGMFVQLSAGQFSSRVLRWYLADRYQQQVLDFLVGVFGYTATVTLVVGGDGTVHVLSAVASLAVSLAAFVVVIVTITDSARATQLTQVMARIAERTIAAVRRAHPPPGHGRYRGTDSDTVPDEERRLVHAPAAGWIGQIDHDRLMSTLPSGTTVRLWVRAGTFVLRDGVIGDWCGADDGDPSAFTDAIHISATREVTDDVELGLRNLVDVALQALAVGTRDATSAYEAINYLATIVHEILLRDLPDDVFIGPDGRRVVKMAEPTYPDYVDIAFDQIRRSGSPYPTVAVALLTVLEMLVDVVARAGLSDRVEPLERQIARVNDSLERSDLSPADRDQVYRRVAARPAWLRPARGSAEGSDGAG